MAFAGPEWITISDAVLHVEARPVPPDRARRTLWLALQSGAVQARGMFHRRWAVLPADTFAFDLDNLWERDLAFGVMAGQGGLSVETLVELSDRRATDGRRPHKRTTSAPVSNVEVNLLDLERLLSGSAPHSAAPAAAAAAPASPAAASIAPAGGGIQPKRRAKEKDVLEFLSRPDVVGLTRPLQKDAARQRFMVSESVRRAAISTQKRTAGARPGPRKS